MKRIYGQMKDILEIKKQFFRLSIGIFGILMAIMPVKKASAQIIVLSEGFESVSTGCGTQSGSCYHDACQPTGWVTSGGFPFIGTTSSPHSGSKAMQCRYGWTSWMITKGVALTAGTVYTFSYWYKNTVGEANAFTMNAGVSNVNSQCPTMNLLGSVAVAANTTYAQHVVTYTPSVSGTYSFGFRNSNTTFNGTQINVDDVLLTMPNCTVAAVTVNSAGTYCGQTTLLASGGTGGTVYFQGTTSGGTSTATPSIAQVVNTSGTYYFRSFDGSCWGNEGSATITITPGPCKLWLNQNCAVCAAGCYIDGGNISPTRTIQTASTATTTSNYGYVFWTFVAVKDSTYYFDLCSSTGATSTILRLHKARITLPLNNFCSDSAGTETLLLENIANGCAGTGAGLSKLIWTCQNSGVYFLESAGNNFTYWGVQANATAALSYKTLPSYSYVCSDVFYDKGNDGYDGSASSYNNNEDWIYTYYPTDTVTGAISAQFTSFSTAGGDILYIYDGNSINAPLIQSYSGPSITIAPFTSTASDGSITFQFTSDDTGTLNGWQANISCVDNVGFGKHFAANKLRLYPNPANDEIRIAINGLKAEGVSIYNVVGERMFAKMNAFQNEMRIDLTNLPAGIYFLHLTNQRGELMNARFVKN